MKNPGGAREQRRATLRRDDHSLGRSSLTASVVAGRREPGKPFPNFWRPACSFAFGIFGIFVLTELGGIPGRAGRPGLAERVLVPFGAGVRLLTHPGVPCVASLDPRSSRVRDFRPCARPLAQRFVRSSGAFAADPSPRVGNCLGCPQIVSESRPIGAACYLPSSLHPRTLAEGPGGSIGVSAPSKWTRVSPDERKRENRRKFGPISWGGGWGWGGSG